MSCNVETIITCDGKRASCHGNDASADMRYLPAAEQRKRLKAEGWVCRGACDYCPACAAALHLRVHKRKA